MIFQALRNHFRKRKYRPGAMVTLFVARDIRRDVKVISADEIEVGYVIAEICTWNVLYTSRCLSEKPAFEPAKRVSLKELHYWSGESWGGLPDGTSFAQKKLDERGV